MTDIARETAEQIVQGINIPPRPVVVMAVMDEREKDEPALPELARLIAADVALSAAVIKTVNAPLYGLNRRISSVDEAVQMLGLRSLGNLVTGLALRTTLKVRGIERFWDQAAHTALLASHLARQARVSRDEAHLFGLFRDAGIPMMLQRFGETYAATLAQANQDAANGFTEIEDARHGVNHAVLGYYIARGWGLGDSLRTAILRHHDRQVLADNDVDMQARRFIALGHLAGYLENQATRPAPDLEWVKFSADVLTFLMIDPEDLPELEDEARSLLLECGV